MSKKDILLTSDGFLELEEELNELKNVRRPKVIEAIKDARSQGDLSENADYDAARNEQAEVEGRIKELEFMLANATIIEKKNSHIVDVGSTVTIKYVDDDEEEVYHIVGRMEADPFENKISNESPVGKALLGAKVGEVVTVETQAGDLNYKVLEIQRSN